MTKTITSAGDLQGVFPALFTPLKDDDPKRLNNSIDYDKAKKIIDDLINMGVNGLVPVGTTGQSATLSPQQHVDFIKFSIDYIDERVPIIAGAGSNCTRESVETILKIQQSTRSLTFLCVTGYYNNPPQEGIRQHYETLAAETGANIIIYNVPGRTQSYIEPETIIQLSSNEKIIGLKQAVDFKSPGKMREDLLKILSEVKQDEFSVLSGEDDALFSILKMGGSGIITATGNIPEASQKFIQIYSQFQKGKINEAECTQDELAPFIRACFIRKNPVPLAALFNSPLYQPLIDVEKTNDGAQAHQELMTLINEKAPSLKKYF